MLSPVFTTDGHAIEFAIEDDGFQYPAQVVLASGAITHLADATVVTELVTRGVTIAPITLHCGVSSLEADEDPYPEQYDVPPATARLVDLTRRSGGRVIAAGTTVVRALETAARGPQAG